MEKQKLCQGCQMVYSLNGGFYKAGKSYQKLCIKCHNKKRYDYDFKSNYTKKIIGYDKLDEELRKKIEYDIYVRINFKDISKKYDLNYQTLLRWNKTGKIGQYNEK